MPGGVDECVPKSRLTYLQTSGTETFDSDMFCLLKPREPTVRELRPKGLIPELLRGQSLQFDLPSLGVPVGHVGVQVSLERLEVGPLPAP